MDTNAIGDRGESIFSMRVTEYFLFRAYFLGEKAPVGDFILEINDEKTPYECMVQVKSTSKGYTKSGNLNASVPNDKLIKLVNRPLPTYVAGVDEENEIVYICSAFDPKVPFSTIPKKNILEKGNPASQITLETLKEDIIKYWQHINIVNNKSTFSSVL